MCQNEHDWFSQLTYRLKLSGRQIALLIILLSLLGAPAVQSQNLQCIFSGTVSVDSLAPPTETVIDLLRSDSSYIRTAYYQQGTYGVSALESDGLAEGDTLLFLVTVPNQPSFIARTFGDEPTFQGGFPPVLKTVHLFKNRAPLPFSLITPSDSVAIDSVVNFRWRSAVDPDGDSVVYTLRIFRDGLPYLTREDISDTTVSVPVDSLLPDTWFEWNVMASDGFEITASIDTLAFILVVVGIHPPTVLMPTDVELYQNYPNPFNPQTHIRYRIEKASKIYLSVYNILGQKIATLVEDIMPPGSHEVLWNGLDNHGNQAPAGLYVYHLKVGDRSLNRKMILAK